MEWYPCGYLKGTTDKSLCIINSFIQRPESLNIDFSDPRFKNKITYMLSTSNATEGKAPLSARVINFGWDTGKWGTQFALGSDGLNAEKVGAYMRTSIDGADVRFTDWLEFITESNINDKLYFESTSIIDKSSVNKNYIGYTNPIPSSLFGHNNSALYQHVYSSKWKHQILGDYYTGQLAVRGMDNGAWKDYRIILDSINYKQYAMPRVAEHANEFNFSGWGNNNRVWFNFRDGLTDAAASDLIQTYCFGDGSAKGNLADINFRGATFSQPVTSAMNTATHLNGAKGINVLINSTAPAGYNMLCKLNSANGVFNIGHFQDAIHVYYISNTKINANTNSFDKDLTLLDKNGNSYFPGEAQFTSKIKTTEVGGRTATKDSSQYTCRPYIVFNDYAKRMNFIGGDNGYYYSNYVAILYGSIPTLCPSVNGVGYLGSASYRWQQLYATNGSISTSDRREKTDISYIGSKQTRNTSDTYMSDETLVAFFNGLMACIYKRTNGESGRPHHGFIAQDIEELLQRLGIKDHAGFIKSPKTREVEVEEEAEVEREFEVEREIEETITNEDGTIETITKTVKEMQTKLIKEIQKRIKQEEIPGEYIYGLRYEEFIADIVRYCQILYTRNETLERTVQVQQEKTKKLEERIAALEKIINQAA
ncbi:MAG: tail fiber domain-containing protein [Lachnospiraceae bacterium]|nr:tail fiber domain-containing protein [Lachnospiraceae bacterium]